MKHAIHAAAFRPRYPTADLGEAARKAVEAAGAAA
jgi:hypothetical protein